MKNNTVITKDVANRKLHVTREFAAPVEKVWKAWTESNILDKWWAPRPWRTETKSMDFTDGGLWLYSMVGPEGERHYCRVDFEKIVTQQSFTALSSFCDENGNINADFPQMHWFSSFYPSATGTRVEVELSFDKEADMKKIIEMGFEGGFTMGLNNLEELLEAQPQL